MICLRKTFPAELDRLWGEVKPLYEALHCHARAKLGELYGTGPGSTGWTDSRAFARQYVGAGLEQYLSAGSTA